MSKISLVYAYYNNPNMLDRHLQEWARYPTRAKAQLEAVIVDDGSQQAPIRGLPSVGFPVRAYRITTDTPWNQDGARNLCMHHVRSDWALLADMDHLVPYDQIENVIAFAPKVGSYYMPGQRTVTGEVLGAHPNTFLFNRNDFWMMGGYDEDFAGFYGSDGNFRKCAKGAGLKETPTLAFHLVVYRDTDIFDANTKLPRKRSQYDASMNPYLNGKRRGPAYRAVRPLRFTWVPV